LGATIAGVAWRQPFVVVHRSHSSLVIGHRSRPARCRRCDQPHKRRTG
jgi:hypothetical protein